MIERTKIEKQLRYLTSCQSDVMDDYSRLNSLMKVGREALALIIELRHNLFLERARHYVLWPHDDAVNHDTLPPCDVEMSEKHHGC